VEDGRLVTAILSTVSPVFGTAEPLASGEAIINRLIANGGLTTTLATGTVTFTYWKAATSGVCANVLTATAGTAASGLTYAAVGVYSVDASGNLTLLGSTGDLHTTLWINTFTAYTSPLVFTRQAGAKYALGALAVGTTPPSLAAGSDYFLFNPSAPIVFGSLSGQSVLPASVTAGSIGTGQSGGVQAVVAP